MNASKALLPLLILFISLFIFYAPNSQSTEDTREEYWMGIYSGNKRVGYSYNSIKTIGGITEIQELTKLKIDLLGKENDVETKASYKLKDYKILSFNYVMKSGSMDLKAHGERKGNTLIITMDTVSGISHSRKNLL